MKNYTYGWRLKEQGFVEVPESDYTARQMEMKEFIDSMSRVITSAKCGWNGVVFKVMRYNNGIDDYIEKYMVLHNGDKNGGRWIPITGNSKGCNFAVLGENLW